MGNTIRPKQKDKTTSRCFSNRQLKGKKIEEDRVGTAKCMGLVGKNHLRRPIKFFIYC